MKNVTKLKQESRTIAGRSIQIFLVGSVKRIFSFQGHPRSLILVRIESAYATSY